MKPVKTCFFLFVLTIDLIFHQPVQAQISAKHSVFGNGSVVIENSTYRAMGTFGQPVMGVMMNSTYKHAIGFWYFVKVADDRFRVPVDLPAGLNMISLPLQPDTPLTASTLATTLGATLVIKYDTARDRFVPYIPATQAGENFPIEMGQGYIVNLLAAKAHPWEGTPWGEPILQAPPSPPLSRAWAFVVAGRFEEADESSRELHVAVVTNLRTGETVEAPIRWSEQTTFMAVFADVSRRPVVFAGDPLEIQVRDGAGNFVIPPIQREVGADEIRRAYLMVTLDKRSYRPLQSALFQNYPNPFNPETWIPYQLAQDAEVRIGIYDMKGVLVRQLEGGHQQAGYYHNRLKAASWDGRNASGEAVASGVYFYQLRTSDFVATRRMVILK